MSLIKSVITALTALHKVLKTLTVAKLVKKKVARYLYNPDVHHLIHNIPLLVLVLSHMKPFCKSVAYPGILFGRGGSTNSVEDRGQRFGGGSPLVRGYGGSCNLVQEISFQIVTFS